MSPPKQTHMTAYFWAGNVCCLKALQTSRKCRNQSSYQSQVLISNSFYYMCHHLHYKVGKVILVNLSYLLNFIPLGMYPV